MELTSAIKQETILAGKDVICVCVLQYMPDITYSSDPKLDHWVRMQIDSVRSLQCDLNNNNMVMHVILVCLVRNYQCQRSNLTVSSKSRQSFDEPMSEYNDIISADETSLVCLYIDNPHHSINVLSYETVGVKVVTINATIQPGPIPATSVSVQYPSRRVYHLIQ